MSNEKKRLVWVPFSLALAVIIGIFLGRYYDVISRKTSTLFSGENKVEALLNMIEAEYVDTVSQEKLVEDVMPKIINELDPHSVYIPASDVEGVNEELEGNFSGIGIQFNLMNDTINVVSVISGGPSEKAGLLPGDRIVSVNDSVFVGKELTNEKVLKTLKGTKGTEVVLGVKRNTSKKPLSFKVTRGDIPVNSVDVAYMLSPKTGYIKISKFGRTTYGEFMNALARLRKQGADRYVIDLRSNPGGYMDAVINMVNEFLPKDRLIVYAEGKSFPRNDAYATGTGAFQNNQIVVLTDEWSASSSEIFAGAIQDNDRGLIIGRRTFGKGLVQQQYPFGDGSAVRLTVARYYTPSGRSIQKEYKMGDNEDYSMDLMNRYLHGEFFNQDSIKQNEEMVYTTIGGRKVYGGGGIMPDIFVPRDTAGITSYYNNIINQGLLFQFAFNYADRHRDELSKAKDHKSILPYLNGDMLLNEFVNYAAEKGVKPRPVYINISRNLIVNQLQSYIARNILGDDAFYPLFFRDDVTLRKAQELLDQGKSFPNTEKEK